MSRWNEELLGAHSAENIRLLLLGGQNRVLLHQWQGQNFVSVTEELNETNCDWQALQLMTQSRTSGTGDFLKLLEKVAK